MVVLEACQYLAALIIEALNGAGKEEVLFGDLSLVPGFQGRTSLETFARHLKPLWYRRPAEHMEPGAYVLDTLACALWALSESTTFEEGLLLAVNLGGDADTVGAVYGQVAGAAYGVESVPVEWKEGLCGKELIANVSATL